MFASLQSPAAQKILLPFNFKIQDLKTIVLVEDEKIFLRSRAVLKITSRLDGLWKLSALLYIFPPFVADIFYNLIAKYRYRIFGKRNECMIPDESLKERFVDRD